jgi:acetyl-CoA carboxylase carboxyl transferase subunit beta
MSVLYWVAKRKNLNLLNAPHFDLPKEQTDDLDGVWARCDKCGVPLYVKILKERQSICSGCGYLFIMSSSERINQLIDQGTWRPFNDTLSPGDPLEFEDSAPYRERVQRAQDVTGLQDAVQTGTGLLDGIPVAFGAMDFNFMGGSMGSAVGEKITRLIEYATRQGLPLILVCASGGARMQEGVLSLMQMAKISAALHIHQNRAKLLYFAILTSPTTGGVTASFASLGDLLIAEPKALIAFAGRRVIRQTIDEELPDDFQTAEYVRNKGLLDLIVPRTFLKQALSELMIIYRGAPLRQRGFVPYGYRGRLTQVHEEYISRCLIPVHPDGPKGIPTEEDTPKIDYPKLVVEFQNLLKLFDANIDGPIFSIKNRNFLRAGRLKATFKDTELSWLKYPTSKHFRLCATFGEDIAENFDWEKWDQKMGEKA